MQFRRDTGRTQRKIIENAVFRWHGNVGIGMQ
jgi:hypothetical protein